MKYLKKLFQYAIFLKHDFDYDFSSIYRVLHFKLTRMDKVLFKYSAPDDKEVIKKALRLCIILSNKLYTDDYNVYYNRHSRKWGELQTWTTPLANGHYSWHGIHPKAIFEKDRIQERKEFQKTMIAESKARDRDKKLLFSILEKYIERFWD